MKKEYKTMSIQTTTMSQARANFAEALDAVSKGEIVMIKRRGKPDTAIIDADLLEDFLAAANPRLISKTIQARQEKDTISFDEAFTDI